MNIVYIHQHFSTTRGRSGTRSYDFARLLVERGHRVTVLAGVYGAGDAWDVPPDRWIVRRNLDGIDLRLVNVRYDNRQTFLGQIAAFLVFMVVSTLEVLRIADADVVFATSTPLTVGVPGTLMRYLRRTAFVFEVRDIWPESAVEAGALKNPILVAIAKLAARVFYHAAGRIVAIGDRMAERLRNQLGPAGAEKVRVIPLGTDCALFGSAQPDHAWRAEHDLSDKCVAVYAGAHSRLNGLHWVLKAAACLKADPQVRIVLIGDGVMKPSLLEQARTEGLSNVLFLDPVPKERLAGILRACDVAIMPLVNVPIIDTACPNKFMDYLAAGLPVVVNFEGEAGWICEAEGCGLVVPPENPEALAAAIRRLAGDRLLRQQMGRRARDLALRRFDRARLVEDFEQVLREARHERSR